MFCPLRGAKKGISSWIVNILVKLVSNDPQLYYKQHTALSQAAIKTSQDNGYAHRSLWHQAKMMVTVYLKQSFVQNLSQQKKSKLEITITITRSEKGKKLVLKELRTVNQ